MDNLLISIKPEYVEKIIAGEKKYEFRRGIFKREVEIIYIYSTNPVKKIIGYFKCNNIIEDAPEKLWDSCHEYSGISKEPFFEYFKGKETGFAIEISELIVFDKPLDVSLLDDFTAPQSFCYVKKSWMEIIDNINFS